MPLRAIFWFTFGFWGFSSRFHPCLPVKNGVGAPQSQDTKGEPECSPRDSESREAPWVSAGSRSPTGRESGWSGSTTEVRGLEPDGVEMRQDMSTINRYPISSSYMSDPLLPVKPRQRSSLPLVMRHQCGFMTLPFSISAGRAQVSASTQSKFYFLLPVPVHAFSVRTFFMFPHSLLTSLGMGEEGFCENSESMPVRLGPLTPSLHGIVVGLVHRTSTATPARAFSAAFFLGVTGAEELGVYARFVRINPQRQRYLSRARECLVATSLIGIRFMKETNAQWLEKDSKIV
ncbi:hypothetical protein C8F01DRAFT_1080165 [Mycena amicta]|nr:hypothetical protein C8F01DRAFT_1080165 [Mycena amicta]